VNQLAVDQLRHLADASAGAIQVLGESSVDGFSVIELSLDTSGIVHASGGIRIRNRERFQIVASGTFPFQHPSVLVPHRRWAGTAHVQWGRHLCLYAAPSVEWNPGDGMRGLVNRLNRWLQNAAAGTLDPDGQPLHPPVAYPSKNAGEIVVRADLGRLVPWSEEGTTPVEVFAWCIESGDRIDVVAWSNYSDAVERVLEGDFDPKDASRRSLFLVPCVLIRGQIGFEYPQSVLELAGSLQESGFSQSDLIALLSRGALVNNYLASLTDRPASEPFPTALLLGTPSRRIDGVRLAHLASWKFDDLGGKVANLLGRLSPRTLEASRAEITEIAESWLGFAKTSWMTLHEDRPEVTRRRDADTSAEWLRGKRVLVMGCGALGGPVAEHCVRAGVAALSVADKGIVSPGVLVRQPYVDADIGTPKAESLAARLSTIRDGFTVAAVVGDVMTKVLTEDLTAYDLILDATADASVRAFMERLRTATRETIPTIVTMVIGHTAQLGVVTISPSGCSGGSADILRKLAVRARRSPELGWTDVADDFFPENPRTELFFPEPGCSSPTFVGASAQVVGLASAMLVGALNELSASNSKAPGMTALAVQLGGAAVREFFWLDDLVVADGSGSGYEVRLSREAVSEMLAESRRGKRIRGDRVETGGMLIGSFDEAAQIAWADVAAGPPPDSALSTAYFDHGTSGTQNLIEYLRAQTQSILGFVGIWHTHPHNPARPSSIDEAGMNQILSFDSVGRRALMVIIGGSENKWNEWRDGTSLPDVFARVVDKPLHERGTPWIVTFPSTETSFAGGYGYPRGQRR
jgi:integrative and conjugative element protein (TIGR02256 family)